MLLIPVSLVDLDQCWEWSHACLWLCVSHDERYSQVAVPAVDGLWLLCSRMQQHLSPCQENLTWCLIIRKLALWSECSGLEIQGSSEILDFVDLLYIASLVWGENWIFPWLSIHRVSYNQSVIFSQVLSVWMFVFLVFITKEVGAESQRLSDHRSQYLFLPHKMGHT